MSSEQLTIPVPTSGLTAISEGLRPHEYDGLVVQRGSIYREGRFLGYLNEMALVSPEAYWGDDMRPQSVVEGSRYDATYTPAEGPCP